MRSDFLHRQQDPPYRIDMALVAKWPDACLFRKLGDDYGGPADQDDPPDRIRLLYRTGVGQGNKIVDFSVRLDDGYVEYSSGSSLGAFYGDDRQAFARLRWAAHAIGLRDKRVFPFGNFGSKHNPNVIVVRNAKGSSLDAVVAEAAALLARHKDLFDSLGKEVLKGTTDGTRLERLLGKISDGLSPLEGRISLKTWYDRAGQDAPGVQFDFYAADLRTIIYSYVNLSVDGFWRDVLFDEPLSMGGDRVRSNCLRVMGESQFETWLEQQLEPGALSIPEEELSPYILLGEPTPYLWGERRFLDWALGRAD